MERRQHRRFDLRVPVQFKWKDRKRVHHLGAGLTRDISSKGIFVYTDSLPPQDTKIQTEFSFPTSSPVEIGVQVTARARVVRLEPATPGKTDGGFALVNESFALRRKRSNRIA